MTTTPIAPDYAAIKTKQQQTWASGDFSVVASRIVLSAERLAEAADLTAGSTVLDVATGSGNAAIAAARHGTHVIGVDYVPALLEDARDRATAEGLDVEFRLGDAEDLPIEDNSVDAVLSVYGTMFAPNHEQTAAEIIRVARRPGAVVGLASWTPTGFIGEMFGVISRYVPPPAGVRSPMLWGTQDHLVRLFGADAIDIESTELTQSFRFTSPDEFVEFFRRWYGPTNKAFGALEAERQVELHDDLVELAEQWDIDRRTGALTIRAEYLQSIITLR